MAEYDRIQKKQESRAVASNGAGSRQLKGLVDNSSQVAKSRNFQSGSKHNLFVIQQKAAIRIRKRLNKRATRAIRLIKDGGPIGNNATLAEVQAHDRAMNPGQHHAMRNVRRADLIADLQQRKLDHANNNIRDTTLRNDALRQGLDAQATQL